MMTPLRTPSVVAAANNDVHTSASVSAAVGHLLEHLDPPLHLFVRPGDRVLVKVNMGCAKLRNPEARVTTHPSLVEAIIRLLQNRGARVCFGDDVARAGKHVKQLWKDTGMWEIAQRTGATLIDFVAVGAREVRGGLFYPRKYLVTNAYFDADVVINAASCRSHANIVMSGAIKNMFGFVVGKRKQLIHRLFRDDPRRFARAIADIHRTIPADLSILDLTSVREAQGISPAIQQVGVIFASTDPVALDTVAALAIGYQDLPIWTTLYGDRMGLGHTDISKIEIRGIDWQMFKKRQLKYPLLEPPIKRSIYDLASNFANNTFLRPRPVISAEKCTGCGDCASRCPVGCIKPTADRVFTISLSGCVDCECCLKMCEEGALNLEHIGMVRAIREITGRMKSADSNATAE